MSICIPIFGLHFGKKREQRKRSHKTGTKKIMHWIISSEMRLHATVIHEIIIRLMNYFGFYNPLFLQTIVLCKAQICWSPFCEIYNNALNCWVTFSRVKCWQSQRSSDAWSIFRLLFHVLNSHWYSRWDSSFLSCRQRFPLLSLSTLSPPKGKNSEKIEFVLMSFNWKF